MTLTEIGRALYGMNYFHAQMARDLGVSRQWVSRLCNGHVGISDELKNKLWLLIAQRKNDLEKIALSAK